MKLVYEGKEINLNISKCIITDNIEGKADTLEIEFADINNECRTWEFKKGHTIKVIDAPFSTGTMYVDNYSTSSGKYNVKALSIKKKFKTKHSRSWENITFLNLAKDLVEGVGLNLKTYGIENYRYYRIDQIDSNNIAFLNYRCMLEGYILKITDSTVVIISDNYLKNQNSVADFDTTDFIGNYEFKCTSNDIYGGCVVRSNITEYIESSYIKDNSNEDILYKNIPVYSIGEAERYSKNILNAANKEEITGSFTVKNNNNIAAGSVINISNISMFNGKYIVEKITKNMIDGKMKVKARKLEV